MGQLTTLLSILSLISLLFLAGCSGEDRRGKTCTSDADCSWCDSDGFAFKGTCETYEDQKTCSFATTISCKRVAGPNGVCVLNGGMPTCVSESSGPSANTVPSTITKQQFSQCLSEKGAVMYGNSATCPDTKAQKKMFGDSFEDVNYHEYQEYHGTTPITETPSWVINGELHSGKLSFAQLSSLTGCQVPT